METMGYAELFLEESLSRTLALKKQADAAIRQLNDEMFFAEPSPGSNSVAIIVKHLAGNFRSRWSDFLTSDGEKASRERDKEFLIEESDSRDSLLNQWEEGWGILVKSLGELNVDDLPKSISIRGKPHTVVEAILRQLAHTASHVGQIVFVAKMHRGEAWQSLSIKKGQSEQFNEDLGYKYGK